MAFDWNGFYVGVNAGYSWGSSEGEYTGPASVLGYSLDMEPSGGLVGVQAGVNHTLGNGLVVGAEAGLAYSWIGDSIYDDLADFAGRPGNEVSSESDWSATLLARLGFDGGDYMPYLAGGLVAAHVTASSTDGPVSESAVLGGLAGGGGIEFAVNDSVTVKAEYLYSVFGDHTWFEGEDYQSQSSSTSHTVRVGVNFALD